jgi:hypothetical protein
MGKRKQLLYEKNWRFLIVKRLVLAVILNDT